MKIPCPQCGLAIVKAKLKPFMGKNDSVIEVPGGVIKGYDYNCPKCKTQSYYNKDVIKLMEGEE